MRRTRQMTAFGLLVIVIGFAAGFVELREGCAARSSARQDVSSR